MTLSTSRPAVSGSRPFISELGWGLGSLTTLQRRSRQSQVRPEFTPKFDAALSTHMNISHDARLPQAIGTSSAAETAAGPRDTDETAQ